MKAARVTAIAYADDLNIVHSAAVIKGARESEGRRFLEFLKSGQARAVFTARGFTPKAVLSARKPSLARVEG